MSFPDLMLMNFSFNLHPFGRHPTTAAECWRNAAKQEINIHDWPRRSERLWMHGRLRASQKRNSNHIQLWRSFASWRPPRARAYFNCCHSFWCSLTNTAYHNAIGPIFNNTQLFSKRRTHLQMRREKCNRLVTRPLHIYIICERSE